MPAGVQRKKAGGVSGGQIDDQLLANEAERLAGLILQPPTLHCSPAQTQRTALAHDK
jgi:hypothetical protein